MKQRITYFVPRGTQIEPASIIVKSDTLGFAPSKPPALEKRITAGLSELPDELRDIFNNVHELHIRWSSRLNYHANLPLVSRLPSGLHVFFTPMRADGNVDICSFLQNAFGDLKCSSVAESFSSPPILSERFSSASTYQYFSPLPKLLGFQTFLARNVCNEAKGKCINEVASLSHASYIDIDYDALSHTVTVTAFWKAGIQSEAARPPLRKREIGDSLEVGILHEEEPEEPEELKFGGYLTVVGADKNPSGTLFSFPSRHHTLPSSKTTQYKVGFEQPAGLHPKLNITFPTRESLVPPKEGLCALHAYFTLPSPVFIDRYQLSDPLFLGSQNLVALRSLSGEQDLEAPDWVVKRWGSAALLELAHPEKTVAQDATSGEWTVTIPTNLRYLHASPNATSPGHTPLDVPWPTVFWACEAEEGLKMSTNPFDRTNLGYDGLFGPKTMFYHIPPALDPGEQLIETISVPVLEPDTAKWVQIGTLAAVVLGFGWVCWQLLRTTMSAGKKREHKKVH